MSNSGRSAVQFTPSDTVLLAYERFAAKPGASHKFKKKALSFVAVKLPLLVGVIGAVAAVMALAVLLWWVLAILVVCAVAIVFWFRKAISTGWKPRWEKMKDSEKKFDGVVTPFQRGHAVLEEPLAMALISSALLANESAGLSQLVLDKGILQAVPAPGGKPWPPNSLEDRLRRNRQLAVAEIVEDWLAEASEVPYRRAVHLAEQGFVARGLAVLTEAGYNQQAALTEAASKDVKAIDGGAANLLLEACQQNRPEVWKALEKAIGDAIQKQSIKRSYGYSAGVNYSTEVVLARDAPLAVKLQNKTTTRYASEKDAAPVQLLEAGPAIPSSSDQPDQYSTQRQVAAKLPGWATSLINLFKKFLSPTSAEVGAAIKARVEAQKSAAPERHETVDTSATVAVGQSASIPTRLFEANQLPAPTEEQRKLLDRTGRDWARLQHEGWETPWQQWRTRRARARLLKSMPIPYRLLMLRVFGSPSYDDLIELIKPWRRVGMIQHLEGFDTIGASPEAIKAVKAGRIEDVLFDTKERVERELSALSLKPDKKELLFERQAFQCTDKTWQLAVRGMLDGADAVVMDLSSLSPTNQGCAWELGQLLDRVPLSRVTLLVNDSTDLDCLQTILDAAARRVSEKSPNREDSQAFWRLVRIGGLSQRQANESYFDWKRRIDTRLEPEILTSFLMTTAEPRRNSSSG